MGGHGFPPPFLGEGKEKGLSHPASLGSILSVPPQGKFHTTEREF